MTHADLEKHIEIEMEISHEYYLRDFYDSDTVVTETNLGTLKWKLRRLREKYAGREWKSYDTTNLPDPF